MRGGLGDMVRKWQPSNPDKFAEGLANTMKKTGRAALAIVTDGKNLRNGIAKKVLGVAGAPLVGDMISPAVANAEDDVRKIKDFRYK